MSIYYRPLVQTGPRRPDTAHPIAGGDCWFTHVEAISRTGPPRFIAASNVPTENLARLTAPRAAIAELAFSKPLIMGILNVTPDSFSDGGAHRGLDIALKFAQKMHDDGADIIDIGGESTRPGARTVAHEEEVARIVPVIAALRAVMDVPISIDTRKTKTARAARSAGANLVNDVSGFTFDAGLAPYCATVKLPVCIMHTKGNPETMHLDPHYDNVLLDVYDFLYNQIVTLEKIGISRDQIIVDPGIGFGKTIAHNLTLLNGIGLFHSLGCPILLGASRKGFIGTIGAAPIPNERAPGSIAVALAAIAQGVQIVRVHDVKETQQAIRLWQAVTGGEI